MDRDIYLTMTPQRPFINPLFRPDRSREYLHGLGFDLRQAERAPIPFTPTPVPILKPKPPKPPIYLPTIIPFVLLYSTTGYHNQFGGIPDPLNFTLDPVSRIGASTGTLFVAALTSGA